MQNHVNRIIEMALDFGEFEVTDPHDPEFHAAMAGQRVVFYYGTTTAHFWEIVKNGINAGPTVRQPKGEDRTYNDISFERASARDNAYRMAHRENNRDYEGPIKPMVIVGETTFKKPIPTGATELDRFVAGTSIGAYSNSLLPTHIRPTAITGVFYPEIQYSWETPIKKFIEKVKMMEFPEIPYEPGFKRSHYRPGKSSKESWQHMVVRYVNDLLNYSSNYFQYLVSDEVPKPYHDTIIREATKLGLSKMLHWTGTQFMEWVYAILPLPVEEENLSKEDDIAQVMREGDYNGWTKPFYNLWKKYSDDTSWEYRTGRKTYSPHE